LAIHTIKSVLGPQEIKGERGLLVGYVTMNTRDRDEVSVVEDAEAVLQGAVRDGRLKLPPGYYWEWSGQFENQVRATKRMSILVPVCLLIMFVMLYVGFKRWWIAPIIYFGILVSASGGFIMLALWGVNLSIAVWVGFRPVRRGGRRRRDHLDLPRKHFRQSDLQLCARCSRSCRASRLEAHPSLPDDDFNHHLRPHAHFLGDRTRLRRDATDGHSERGRNGGQPLRHHLHRAVPVLCRRGVEVEASATPRTDG